MRNVASKDFWYQGVCRTKHALPRKKMGLRVFASHDWGRGSSTHARVRDVVTALRARNMDVWFDETHMTGNILDAMCAGIEDADVVLIFVTRNYMQKVEHGPDTDNVRREFMFAAARPERPVRRGSEEIFPLLTPSLTHPPDFLASNRAASCPSCTASEVNLCRFGTSSAGTGTSSASRMPTFTACSNPISPDGLTARPSSPF